VSSRLVAGLVAGSVGLAVYVLYRRKQQAAKVAAALAGPCAVLRKGKAPAKKLALLLLETLHPSPPPASADLQALFASAPAASLDAKAFGAATAQDDDLWTDAFAGSSTADLVQAFATVTKGAGSGPITQQQAITAAKAYGAMHVLASMLMSTSGLKDIQSLFVKFDKDHNGLIDPAELAYGLCNDAKLSVQLGGLEAPESALLFARLARGGSLSFAAFISSLSSFSVAQRFSEAMASDAGKAELRALFDTLDKDGNKKISREEWKLAVRQNTELMKSWFSGHTNVEIREAFDQIDVDHSGDITWDEFEKYASS